MQELKDIKLQHAQLKNNLKEFHLIKMKNMFLCKRAYGELVVEIQEKHQSNYELRESLSQLMKEISQFTDNIDDSQLQQLEIVFEQIPLLTNEQLI
ncbi:hypothetical protein SS50377_25850 [Spironucleus salmonicida]|uniref:Uncharacterized protein n=1 Tax=Spironucleus salmonicida TaxID=348837 RepID=V6LX93_9EUKA|nr:hypothetical protein SS50377_25850 [Spironucleus salmonicida]|eukprot:EST45444.1 Hypothetical protein SS50377_14637 [Spironucleus salmonicida]